MSYSQYFFHRQKQIPTVVSLIVVLVVAIFFVKLFSLPTIPSRAGKKVLKQIQILNISNNDVMVFWETVDPQIGWINYGENQNLLDKRALDERDLPTRGNKWRLHFVHLTDLEQNKTYFFKLTSNKQVITDENNKPFSFKTQSATTQVSSLKPMYGKITKVDGSGLEGAIVILSLQNRPYLGSLTKASGEWLFVPRIDKAISADDEAVLDFYCEDQSRTTVKARINNLSPLAQTLTIGKDYDFSDDEKVLSASTVKKNNFQEIDIIFPKEQTEPIPATNPLIKGTALPRTQVFIFIESPVIYSFRTETDSDGVWKINMPEPLQPGKHTITLVTKDKSGKEVKLVRKFVIGKSGEQVQGIATGSATPTLPIQVTSTPSLTQYAVSPTIVITTQIPTPTTPVSGADMKYFSIASGSLILLGLGILLIL